MHPLVSLAKSAVEKYIKENKKISPPQNLKKEFFKKRKGTFVTIKKIPEDKNKKESLRGCIGTFLPTKENIIQEVISNAVAAATKDYRFGKIKKEELNLLSFTVYILEKPEQVKNLEELNPQKYGIIVRTKPISQLMTDVVFNGHRTSKSGLLLPNLEGIDTPRKQFLIASEKAGINPKKEKVFIYRFKVKEYK